MWRTFPVVGALSPVYGINKIKCEFIMSTYHGGSQRWLTEVYAWWWRTEGDRCGRSEGARQTVDDM